MPAESTKRTKLRVFLVDDHPLVRKGIADCIHDEPDMAVCGQAATAEEALEGVARTKPDLALVDISLPGCDGIELTKDIKAEYPRIQVLVLSMHDESLYAQRALRAGASGYVMKSAPAGALIQAIRGVRAGKTVVSPRLRDQLIQFMVGNAKRPSVQQLSDRELQVLRLYGEGRTRGQIATQLHLSIKTVETHRSNICRKLGLKNSTEFLRYAIELIRPQIRQPAQSQD